MSSMKIKSFWKRKPKFPKKAEAIELRPGTAYALTIDGKVYMQAVLVQVSTTSGWAEGSMALFLAR